MTQERGKYVLGHGRPGRGYAIAPRTVAMGGGWKLTLLEHGRETGGGSFPIPKDDALAGMAWWNSMTEEQRGHWLMLAAPTTIADAYRAYLLAEAYADARDEGEAWIDVIGDD